MLWPSDDGKCGDNNVFITGSSKRGGQAALASFGSVCSDVMGKRVASCFTKLREDNDEKEGRFGKAGASKIRIVRPIPPVNPEIICAGRRQNSIGPLALKNKNRVSRRNRRFCVVEKRICLLSESTAGGRTEASLCITQLNITSPYLSSKIAINIY